MEDLIFYNTPYGAKFVIKGDWPEWQRQMWIEALGAPAKVFRPTFENHVVTDTTTGLATRLNAYYFATADTATWIMNKFGASRVAFAPYGGSNELFQADAQERWIVFEDGIALNAGRLAEQFDQNPEDFAPGVAERNCNTDITEARAAHQTLPPQRGNA